MPPEVAPAAASSDQTELKLTPWFDALQDVPAHLGVFEGRWTQDGKTVRGYFYWDHRRFGVRAPTPDKALERKSEMSYEAVTQWRGVDVGMQWIPRTGPVVAADAQTRKTLNTMNRTESKYARYDETASRIILGRLEEAAAKRNLITYGSLVRGVRFQLPDASGRFLQARTLEPNNLSATDIEIIADYCCYLAAATFRDVRVLINALVVPGRYDRSAPAWFFDWARQIGLMSRSVDGEEDDFLAEAISDVYARYAKAA